MTWELTDHACARCFGRVMERRADDVQLFSCIKCKKDWLKSKLAAACCRPNAGKDEFDERRANGVLLYRCAECGFVGVGSAQAVCCCATMVGGRLGLECVANPARSDDLPQEVLVRQRQGGEKPARDRNVPARVEIGGDRGFMN